MNLGIIGAGSISGAYLSTLAEFHNVHHPTSQ
jgi:ketopantoate reductase